MEELNLAIQAMTVWGVGIQAFTLLIIVIILAQVTRILVRLNTLVEKKEKETG